MEASQQAMEYINTLINNINALSASSEYDRQSKKQVVNQLINIESYLSAIYDRQSKKQVVNQLINIESYLSAIAELLKKYGKE